MYSQQQWLCVEDIFILSKWLYNCFRVGYNTMSILKSKENISKLKTCCILPWNSYKSMSCMVTLNLNIQSCPHLKCNQKSTIFTLFLRKVWKVWIYWLYNLQRGKVPLKKIEFPWYDTVMVTYPHDNELFFLHNYKPYFTLTETFSQQ